MRLRVHDFAFVAGSLCNSIHGIQFEGMVNVGI